MGQVAWRADERPVQQGGAVNVQRDGAQGQHRTGQRQGITQYEAWIVRGFWKNMRDATKNKEKRQAPHQKEASTSGEPVITSAHWHSNQVTIYTAVVYHTKVDGGCSWGSEQHGYAKPTFVDLSVASVHHILMP